MKKQDTTAAERQKRRLARKKLLGIVPVTVFVPEDRKDDIRAIAAKMCEQDAVGIRVRDSCDTLCDDMSDCAAHSPISD